MSGVLQEPIAQYLTAKQAPFAGSDLARKFRKEFPQRIQQFLVDKTRYRVVGSTGKGNWTECPWIAILDILVTNTPQSGYYPVFLFKADMTGVYLSLNQGVTEVKENYKRESKKVLRVRAEDLRGRLNLRAEDLRDIHLASETSNAKLYEAGNIIAKYYPSDKLPNDEILQKDIHYFLQLYDELTFNSTPLEDEKGLTAIEKKQYRLHFRVERNTSISQKVKALKGYVCEVCSFDFKTKYGELGADFIEAHHLTPISSLDVGTFKINVLTDFAVLCSNCHKMIHRLDNPSDLAALMAIVKANQASD